MMWERKTWITKLLGQGIGLATCLAMVMLVVLPALVLAAPAAYPCTFIGTASIDGERVEDGTEIIAYAENLSTHVMEMVGSTNTTTIDTIKGYYDVVVELDTEQHSTEIHFTIGGLDAAEACTWVQYGLVECDLTASTEEGGGGGGGGGGGRDTTPPAILEVDLCPEGVTETTADICWRTDERSTSQVEYWTSPSMLSPLDETYVTVHHVKLTDLTPGTTYYYKTMSRDREGNLAVSDVYTFTTLGEAPMAMFTTSDLSISPTEVDIGQEVTISVKVANIGNVEGTYEVALNIDGVIEETKELDIDAGASKTATFTTVRDAAGSYSVTVDGLSGLFTVKEAPAPPPTAPPEEAPEVKPPINWALIGGIIGGVVIVGLAIFFLVKLRRRAQ